MTNVWLADTFMPVSRAPLSVRGRRSQYGCAGPEGRVRSAASMASSEPAGALERRSRAGAEAGEGRA